MDARVNFITLAVTDVAAARRFYIDGLGWAPAFEADGIVMVRLSPTLVLSLWDEDQFEAEVGPISRGDGLVPFTLAHNVPSREEVDRVLAEAEAAGSVGGLPRAAAGLGRVQRVLRRPGRGPLGGRLQPGAAGRRVDGGGSKSNFDPGRGQLTTSDSG